MMGGAFLASSGCATTPGEWVAQKWGDIRGTNKEKDEEKVAAAAAKDASKKKKSDSTDKLVADKANKAKAKPDAKSDSDSKSTKEKPTKDSATKDKIAKANADAADDADSPPTDRVAKQPAVAAKSARPGVKDKVAATDDDEALAANDGLADSKTGKIKRVSEQTDDTLGVTKKKTFEDPLSDKSKADVADDENPFESDLDAPKSATKTAAKSSASKSQSAAADDDPFGADEVADSGRRIADRESAEDEPDAKRDVETKREVASITTTKKPSAAADDFADDGESDDERIARYRKILDGESSATKDEAKDDAEAESKGKDTIGDSTAAKRDRSESAKESETDAASDAEADDTSSKTARLEAEDLMIRAKMAQKKKRYADAVKLASSAKLIEDERGLSYGEQEESPTQLLDRLNKLQQATQPRGAAKSPAKAAEKVKEESRPAAEERSPADSEEERSDSERSDSGKSAARPEPNREIPVAGRSKLDQDPFASEPKSSAKPAGQLASVTGARRGAASEVESIQSEQFVLQGREPQVQANRPLAMPVRVVGLGSSPIPTVRPSVGRPDSTVSKLKPEGATSLGKVAERDTTSVVTAEAKEGDRASESEERENLAGTAVTAPPPPEDDNTATAGLAKVSDASLAKKGIRTTSGKHISRKSGFPFSLIMGFIIGTIGLFGFGYWRRLQIQHYSPRG